MNRILLIGYGNPDRQDDGVAWHILCAMLKKLGGTAPPSFEDDFPATDTVDFSFHLQLTPEMAEELAKYENICFVDAHTGEIQPPVRMTQVASEFQHSPFTHHLTPQSLISMCETVYHKKPEAVLLSVHGYSFGFEHELSKETSALIPEAIEKISGWLENCLL